MENRRVYRWIFLMPTDWRLVTLLTMPSLNQVPTAISRRRVASKLRAALLPVVILVLAVASSASAQPSSTRPTRGNAEQQLLEVMRLMHLADHRKALLKAQALVKEFPNFQLAQLVYGDLLSAHNRPIQQMGELPDAQQLIHKARLTQLREEAGQRLRAQDAVPGKDWVPTQLLMGSRSNKHIIAVDGLKSRVYLLERTATGMQRVADFYASVGKAGIGKLREGDNKTPSGVYFITSYLDPAKLEDLYGSGALPLNYPNQLDVQRGKTGSGIWLHGKPSAEYSRAPLATEGCVALSNPDIERIIETVAVGSTPVIIAPSLQWAPPQAAAKQREAFQALINQWALARASGNTRDYRAFYAAEYSHEKLARRLRPISAGREADKQAVRGVRITDLSLFLWQDDSETLIATFTEVVKGQRGASTIRQYWTRKGTQWKIFSETRLS